MEATYNATATTAEVRCWDSGDSDSRPEEVASGRKKKKKNRETEVPSAGSTGNKPESADTPATSYSGRIPDLQVPTLRMPYSCTQRSLTLPVNVLLPSSHWQALLNVFHQALSKVLGLPVEPEACHAGMAPPLRFLPASACRCAQQNDTTSCGLFMLRNIQCLSRLPVSVSLQERHAEIATPLSGKELVRCCSLHLFSFVLMKRICVLAGRHA